MCRASPIATESSRRHTPLHSENTVHATVMTSVYICATKTSCTVLGTFETPHQRHYFYAHNIRRCAVMPSYQLVPAVAKAISLKNDKARLLLPAADEMRMPIMNTDSRDFIGK
jgi:hypothetical protein